jgi:GNAT superfamily N-acetyltransferase
MLTNTTGSETTANASGSAEPRIRLATMDDLPALSDLIERSMHELVARAYTRQQVMGAIIGQLVGVDTQLIADGNYYVADAGGQVVGCGGWSDRKTLYGGSQNRPLDDGLFLDPAVDPAKIRAFFVHPAWARRGIGRRILELSEQAAQRAGFGRFELMAILTGVPLYVACGYSVTERVDLPLPDGLVFPCMKMVKTLGYSNISTPNSQAPLGMVQ